MDQRQVTIKRLRAVIKLIQQLIVGDFPYESAKSSLERIKAQIELRLQIAESLPEGVDPKAAATFFREALGFIASRLQLIGFLVRATGVRNSFELYNPLSNLVHQLVLPQKDKKLVISSEWLYSPFTYNFSMLPEMNDFVFIGLPASETNNALITPLAGHEIGHNIWRSHKLGSRFDNPVSDKTREIIAKNHWQEFTKYFHYISKPEDLSSVLGLPTWKVAHQCAMRQIEEIYCDYVGIFYFKQSFLYSYAYLLSPSTSGQRSIKYPRNSVRIAAQEYAATKYSVVMPPNYSDLFENLDEPAGYELQLKIAEDVVNEFLDEIATIVSELFNEVGLDKFCEERVSHIVERYRLGVPPSTSESLTNIIAAGWEFYNSGFDGWERKYPTIFENSSRREEVLSDLMYKSMEVADILGAQ